MSIREDSKKIVQLLLSAAVEQGNLRITYQVDCGKIAQELGLESANYCKVCFLYLTEKGCLVPYKESGYIQLHATAIDFLEAP